MPVYTIEHVDKDSKHKDVHRGQQARDRRHHNHSIWDDFTHNGCL
jgi:hypothetical protein